MTATGFLPADTGRGLGRIAAGIGVAVVVLWAMGLDLVHAVVLAAALVALITLRRVPAVNDDQIWPDEDDTRSDTGVRREVARLSWSMQGYESRVQRQSVRRLHDIAVFRLAERGLDLDDPRDYLACESAVGVRAYQVISEPAVRPLYDDFVAAVAAVEQLGGGPSTATASASKGDETW